MIIEALSRKYLVKLLKEEDIPEILSIAVQNPLYYQYCPPMATPDSIKADMTALPEGRSLEDKYYIGFWDNAGLIAVMDLILKYPDANTAWIGFFMMNGKNQSKGIGTAVITEVCDYLKSENVMQVRLGYAKGNPQSEAFWLKNNFSKTGIEVQAEQYTIVVMQREL